MLESYSFTSLQKYDCPWAFYKRYVKLFKEPVTEPLVFGKVVHEALHGVIGKNMSREAALLEALQEAPLKVDVKEALRQLNIGLELWSGYSAAFPAYQAERYFKLPLDPADPFSPVLLGYIDLDFTEIGVESLVLDWKTSRLFVPHDDSKQLGLYSWAISQLLGVSQVKAGLHFLRLGQKSFEIYGPAKLEAARLWAYNRAKEIEGRLEAISVDGEDPKEAFPPAPSARNCRYCGLADVVCGQPLASPETGQQAPPPAAMPASPVEAVTLAAEIMQMEATSGAMKDMLKAWVKANGPVIANGKKWDFDKTTSWQFAPNQLKAMCRAISDETQKNFWEFLTIASTQLKKLGWPEDRLRQYGTPKTSETFRATKAEEAKPEVEGKRKAPRGKVNGKEEKQEAEVDAA